MFLRRVPGDFEFEVDGVGGSSTISGTDCEDIAGDCVGEFEPEFGEEVYKRGEGMDGEEEGEGEGERCFVGLFTFF
jgi:hypothetical protein